tara:strand:- start:642 stop:1427 length:786 start_codon:yes stop_codon:yes gene_type:complete
MPNLILLTGSELRHRYYAETIYRLIGLSGVLIEKKRLQVSKEEITDIVNGHFEQRNNKEKEFFSDAVEFETLECPVFRSDWGGSNTKEAFEWINSLKPDLILVYGTGILKDPLISGYCNRIINCHLGLSPYYKGAATNFWPLVNGEPECVGATFHILTKEVDAGDIFHQVRPILAKTDDCHDIGFKTIQAAASDLNNVVKAFISERIKLVPQIKGDRVYKKRDFNERAVIKMKENFENGMIESYLKNKVERDKHFPVVSNV